MKEKEKENFDSDDEKPKSPSYSRSDSKSKHNSSSIEISGFVKHHGGKHHQLIGEKDNSKRVVKRSEHAPVTRVDHPVRLRIEEVSIESKRLLLKTVHIDTEFSNKLLDAGRRGLIVLNVFDPPDSLTSGLGVFHCRLQIFLKPYVMASPIQFSLNDLDVTNDQELNKTTLSNTMLQGNHPIDELLASFGVDSYSLGAIYPSPYSNERHSLLQFVFQRPYTFPIEPPPKFVHIRVPLECVIGEDSVQILELAPTLADLGAQGYRIAGVYNPFISKSRQSRGESSIIHFFFEKEVGSKVESYLTTVARCQMWVTHVSFGIRVTGRYLRVIREHSEAGWSLGPIIDVVDPNIAGLTILFLTFYSTIKASTIVPNESVIFSRATRKNNSNTNNNTNPNNTNPNNNTNNNNLSNPFPRVSRFNMSLNPETTNQKKINSNTQAMKLLSQKKDFILNSQHLAPKQKQEVFLTQINNETANRLFRDDKCEGPDPSFVYAHNYKELEKQNIKKREWVVGGDNNNNNKIQQDACDCECRIL